MSTLARELNQGAIQRIGADLVHRYNKGTGVRIGILSDGIMPHVAFRSQIKGGWDFINNTALSDISSNGPDDHLFATFAAGLIAGSGVPFEASDPDGPADVGILGVAPEAHLFDLRVVGADKIVNLNAAISAVDWAIANHLEILYFVFGGRDPSSGWLSDFSAAIDRAYSAGVVMFAPVGSNHAQYTNVSDDWPGTVPVANFPARHQNVIGVGEIEHTTDRPDHYETVWDTEVQVMRTWRFYHARDGNTELVAPGGNTAQVAITGVGSTYGTNSTRVDVGTYVAGAIATGVAALIISGGWAVTVGEIRQRLRDTATALTSGGLSAETNRRIYGYGLVNALLAAPPPAVTGTVEEQKEVLKIGSTGLSDGATVTKLADIAPRVDVKADPIPYVMRYPSPRDGETNVPVNSPVRFTLRSDTVGIDITSVRVKINGEVYRLGEPGFSFSGDRHSYQIEVRRPSGEWGYEEDVIVEIEAWDLAGKPGLVYERILG